MRASLQRSSTLGMVYMLIHVLLASLMQLANRVIVENTSLHKLHVVLISHCFALVLVFIYYFARFVFYRSSFSLNCYYIKYHILRGISYATSQGLLIYAYTTLTFVKVSAITLSYPIFAAISWVLFLGSKMGAVRSISTTIGLIGAMIIINPGPQDFDESSLFVVIAVILWVFFDIVTSKLNRREDFHVEFFYLFVFQFLFSVIITTGVGFPTDVLKITWTMNEVLMWSGLGFIVLMYTLTSLAALHCAELVSVAPFYFCTLIIGVVVSYYFFEEPISLRVVTGSMLIILGVSIIAIREYRAKVIAERQARGRLNIM